MAKPALSAKSAMSWALTLPLITGLIGAAIGAFATVMTGAFGYLNKNRELDIQMVNVALTVLSGKYEEKSEPARKFALRALAKYANVSIPDAEFNEWAKGGVLPQGNFTVTPTTSSSPNIPNIPAQLALARLIYGEARSGDTDDRVAVGQVALNQLKNSYRGKSDLASIVYDTHQFSSMTEGDPNRPLTDVLFPGTSSEFDDIYALAGRIIGGEFEDKTSGAMHYFSASLPSLPSWAASSQNARLTLKTAQHLFYTGIR